MVCKLELPTIGCDKCDSGKIKIRNEWGFGWTTKICECEKNAKLITQISSVFQKSNAPAAIFKNYPVEGFQQDVVTIEVLKWFSEGILSKEWLYLTGTPGTGKTYTAMVSLQFALALWRKVLYVNVPRLMDELRPNANNTWSTWMEKCIEADFLILDDLWQEKPSEWVLERLYIIINERYMNRSQTIFTSNTCLDNLIDKVKHPAIISRIRHLALEVDFTGVDRRTTWNAF